MNERVVVPPSALVVLIGAAGSGKSTFAQRNFPAGAIVASDALREQDRAHGLGRRRDVFDQLLEVIEARLQAGQLTVVDATNTDWMRRSELISRARQYGRSSIAIAFALPEDVSLEQNAARSQAVAPHQVKRQTAAVLLDLDRLDLEGFSPVIVLRSREEAGRFQVEIERGPVTRASQ